MPQPIRALSQEEFGAVAFDVMRHVFAIRAELGRFFDEHIYKQELRRRIPGVWLEVPFEVSHDSFFKRYCLDVVAAEGAVFEFKCVEQLVSRHRAQVLHYLMLAEVHHAKLVNMRPEAVEHEFVNSSLTPAARRRFQMETSDWQQEYDGAATFAELLTSLLRDWGVGLELALYEEAMTHFLGGEAKVMAEVPVFGDGTPLGAQRVRLAAPGVAFKLTSLSGRQAPFAEHARCLLRHTPLKAILWANLTLDVVTLALLRKDT